MTMHIKTSFLLSAAFLLATASAPAQNFDQYFEDATLRLDYIMAGNASEQHIYLHDLKKQDRWAGRRGRLAETFLRGNGQLTVRDHASQQTIYVHTFSTLFQEWLQYPEAKTTSRSYETSYNIPFPKQPVDITISLTDVHDQVVSEFTHTVDPSDILIRKIGDTGIPFLYIWKGGSGFETHEANGNTQARSYEPTPFDPFQNVDIANCVDIAIVADGYTESQMGKFFLDARRAAEALFEHEPFLSMKNRFNIVAVAAPSQQEGPSVPSLGIWKNTAVGSHYDTFYTLRYLTTPWMHSLYDLLAGVPFEQIIVLQNSDTYGGGGIYNQITLTTSDHPTFRQVLVHEFGHTYAGLGDEYAYDDMSEPWYPADTEPWEPNLTTLKDFNSKWADLMPEGQPIPTPPDPNATEPRITQVVGVFEGAGYQTKGCYRPAQECRMKVNEVADFCPVCARAIRQMTDFNTANK